MTRFFEEGSLNPASDVNPPDDGVGCSGAECASHRIDWSLSGGASRAAALLSDGAQYISTNPSTSSDEDAYSPFQCVLDGPLAPGDWALWILAKETGAGASWNNHSPAYLLVNSAGKDSSAVVPGSSTAFFGPNAGGPLLSGTYAWFKVAVRVLSGEGDFTPNAAALWMFNPGVLQKTLFIDRLVVEPISQS